MKEGKGTFSNACQASLVEVYIIALKETTIVSFHLTFLYLLFCFLLKCFWKTRPSFPLHSKKIVLVFIRYRMAEEMRDDVMEQIQVNFSFNVQNCGLSLSNCA